MRMVKSRQKKLDDRWGLEKSAKGTRFKLNRDVVGFHLTSRMAIEVSEKEKEVRIKLDQPPSLRAMGALVSLEGVDVGYHTKSGRKRLIVGDVGLVIPQGGRVGFVGAVSPSLLVVRRSAHPSPGVLVALATMRGKEEKTGLKGRTAKVNPHSPTQ